MNVLSILLTLKTFLLVPNLTLFFINLSIFASIRAIIFFILLLEPLIYKFFPKYACCVLEWIVYLLLSLDIYVTSLTLSYFFHKFNLRIFAFLNLFYFFLYLSLHGSYKFNKQFYFSLLATPTPLKYSRNNNLNVPPFILLKTWNTSTKVLVTNGLYLIIKSLLEIFVFRSLFKMLIEKYVHESCDQESINCFLCEFGGESVEMGYLVMVFFVELFGSLVLCWLVYLIENMGKRVSVVALSFIFRIILLSFEHTLGYKAMYTHFLTASPLSLMVHCPLVVETQQRQGVHLLGCLLGAECSKLMFRSQLRKEKVGNDKYIDSIIKKFSRCENKEVKKKSSLDLCNEPECSPYEGKLNELRALVRHQTFKAPRKRCSPASQLSDTSIQELKDLCALKCCPDTPCERGEFCSRKYPNDKCKTNKKPCSFSQTPQKSPCCSKKFLPDFYFYNSLNDTDASTRTKKEHLHKNSHEILHKNQNLPIKKQRREHEKHECKKKISLCGVDSYECDRTYIVDTSSCEEKEDIAEKCGRCAFVGNKMCSSVERVKEGGKKIKESVISPMKTFSQELRKLGSQGCASNKNRNPQKCFVLQRSPKCSYRSRRC